MNRAFALTDSMFVEKYSAESDTQLLENVTKKNKFLYSVKNYTHVSCDKCTRVRMVKLKGGNVIRCFERYRIRTLDFFSPGRVPAVSLKYFHQPLKRELFKALSGALHGEDEHLR